MDQDRRPKHPDQWRCSKHGRNLKELLALVEWIVASNMFYRISSWLLWIQTGMIHFLIMAAFGILIILLTFLSFKLLRNSEFLNVRLQKKAGSSIFRLLRFPSRLGAETLGEQGPDL